MRSSRVKTWLIIVNQIQVVLNKKVPLFGSLWSHFSWIFGGFFRCFLTDFFIMDPYQWQSQLSRIWNWVYFFSNLVTYDFRQVAMVDWSRDLLKCFRITFWVNKMQKNLLNGQKNYKNTQRVRKYRSSPDIAAEDKLFIF